MNAGTPQNVDSVPLATLKAAIRAGLRSCRVEDGAPVPLFHDGDLMHITYMVTAAIAPLVAEERRRAAAEALREAADDWHDIEQALESIEDIILDDEARPFVFTPSERRRIAVCDVLEERAAALTTPAPTGPEEGR